MNPLRAPAEGSPSQTAGYRLGLRVYWEDTDAGGVVYYANYLKFFERARTEWLRARDVHQDQLRTQRGLMFVVAELQTRYLRPARLDDWLEVTVVPVLTGRASLMLDQQVLRAGALLAQAQVRIACVDATRLAPTALPADVRAALTLPAVS